MRYVEPWPVPALADCHFYHSMDLPAVGEIIGTFDLRATFEVYLGNLDFSSARVLEIGPASGFLTFQMERSGANVVCVDVTTEHGWDYVPYPDERYQPILRERNAVMWRLKNSFWLGHASLKSRAQVHYGDIYDLPEGLGRFDIAVLACVLLHVKRPLDVVQQCAEKADRIVIVERLFPELEGSPVMQLQPDQNNFRWDTWWSFSTDVLKNYLAVLEFSRQTVTYHDQVVNGVFTIAMFTLVAEREHPVA